MDLDSVFAAASADALKEGKEKFYDNLINDLSVDLGENSTCISASVLGSLGAKTVFKPQIVFEKGRLLSFSCDCAGGASDTPCGHAVAAALLYAERHPKENTLAATDTAALSLISGYLKMPTRSIPESEQMELFPLISPALGRLSVKLSIGTRPYKIRSITAFLQQVERRSFYRYGTDLAFFHDKERFTDRARALIDLLTGSNAEKSALSLNSPTNLGGEFSAALPPVGAIGLPALSGENTDSRDIKDGKDSFLLMQGDVDLFFDLFTGRTVAVDGEIQNTLVVQAAENGFRPLIIVEKDEGGFNISLKNRPADFILGRRFGYVFTGGGIFKCTQGYLDIMTPLLNMFAARLTVFISDKDMPLFYNNVIFRAEQFADIECASDLSIFKTPDLSAKMYLRREGDAVAAELVCRYDDRMVDIFSDYCGSLRDFHQEASLKAAVEKYFPYAPRLYVEEESEIYDLIAFGLPEIGRFSEIFAEEDSLLKIRRPPAVHVGVRLSGGLLDIEITGEGYTDEELSDVLLALKHGKSYVRLSSGRFITLTDPVFHGLGSISAAGGYKTKFTLPKYFAPFLNRELDTLNEISGEKNAELDRFLTDIKSYEKKDFALPDTLSRTLREYQKSGFKWLKTLKSHGLGGILADDMGLGKSVQLISFILSEKCFPCLIVCPSTLVLNWEMELQKFAPQLKVQKIIGSREKRAEELTRVKDYDIVITSYSLLAKDIKQYSEIPFELAAVDEAQYIKNPATVSSKSAGMINAKHRIALTGTPIENNLSELWSVFDFILPGYLGTYKEFSQRFEQPLLNGDQLAADSLISLTSPFILRRMKSGVLKELPAKTETEIIVPLEGEQAKIYQKTLYLAKESLSGVKNKLAALAHLMRLRQICCDPALIDETYGGNSAKTDLAIQLALNAAAGGHKVLIFSQFTSMLEILQNRLQQEGLSHYLLQGSTPKAERMTMVNRFNKDETQIFLISLRAGGTGINLTGADTVILFDPWWNNSVMNQAADRVYRLGQHKNVQIYKLIMEGTVEQKIQRLGQKKDSLSGMLVDGGRFTAKDIAALLS